MRFNLLMAVTSALIVSSAAHATPQVQASPFAAAPVADIELAGIVGTGDPRWRTPTRMSDELSFSSLRQTASIGSVIKDLWLIDVASPLIAANVRAAPAR